MKLWKHWTLLKPELNQNSKSPQTIYCRKSRTNVEGRESWETHRSDEEQEAGEEEATTNRTDLKWTHEVDDDDDEDEDGDEEFEEVEVWLLLRDFIYSYYPCFSL